jgi:hypothetical protein
MQAPGLVTLGAGVRYFFTRVMKVKHLDPGFGGGEGAVVLEGTGHFALQTAGTFVCVDVQHLLHGGSLLWVAALQPMQSLAYEIKYIAIVGLVGALEPRDNPSGELPNA